MVYRCKDRKILSKYVYLHIMPAVSVIIPSHNLKAYLPATLDSVISQTFADWECIIVDDASSDGSPAVAEEYGRKDARFRTIVLPQNAGVSVARNTGLLQAKGEYVLFLDADDLITPTYMEAAVSAFSKDPALSVVYGRAERFGDSAQWDLPPFSMATMLARNCLYISCFFRRSLAVWTDGQLKVSFDGAFKDGFEDWDFWLSLLQGEEDPRVLCLPQLCFRYRTRRRSRNTGVTDQALVALRHRLWEKHKDLYSKYFCNPLETVEYRRMKSAFEKASRWSLAWKLRLLYRKLFA